MSLHSITLCIRRFLRRMDEEVCDAARMNAYVCACAAEIKDRKQDQEQHPLGERQPDAAAAQPYHATLFGA